MVAKRFVAFLRAVNVGGRTVKSAQLKQLFEAAGFTEVSPFIASGNVVFSTSAQAMAGTLETRLETALQRGLGFSVTTMVRSEPEVVAAGEREAFPASAIGEASLYVGFAKTAPAGEATQKTLAMQTAIDELRIHGREVYWLARKNIAESTISMAALEKALATPATFRNLNTIRRLIAKYDLKDL